MGDPGMNRLKIDTTRSLYKPVEVEIDGKVFEVQPLTRAKLRDLSALEKRIRTGDSEAAYEQLEIMLGTKDILETLTLQHVNEIVTFVTSQIYQPERILPTDSPDEKKAKNLKGPGDKDSQK